MSADPFSSQQPKSPQENPRDPNETSRQGRPDYEAFEYLESLGEANGFWLCPVPSFLRRHGIFGLAVGGALATLGFAITQFVAAGNNLTLLGLVGGLVVALLIAGLGVTALLVAKRSHGTNPKERSDDASDHRNG